MNQPKNPADESEPVVADPNDEIHSPRNWRADGWIAQVIKNDGDDGWAVEMTPIGGSEPALVGPWTMGRDKKNPKPLDPNAFHTLVKTAKEVLARHEHSRRASLHKSVTVTDEGGDRVRVDCDIVPDEDDAHALLSAWNEAGEVLAKVRVAPNFKLTATSAERWTRDGYRTP